MHRPTISLLVAAAVVASLGPVTNARAQALPKATKAYLAKLKLSPGILKGLDAELAVPKAWIAGMKKEGVVRILGSWKPGQFRVMDAPFRERYPSIKVEYSNSGNYHARVVAPLIAFKEGQYLTDVTTGLGGSATVYEKANALEDLRNLPTFGQQVKGANDPNHKWAAIRLRYWCMAYNTNLVKKSELPKTWNDLITNPYWHNGAIGAGNRPQLWIQMLYGAWGPKRTAAYVKQFFEVVKPQFRKEGMSALLALAAAGEFKAALPAAAYNVRVFQKQGAPLAWHCPSPVPLNTSPIGIFRGNPHLDASRVWVNWMLSKEGQLAQFVADSSPPSHVGMQQKAFFVFPDELAGKKIAFRYDKYERPIMAMWTKYWNSAGQ